MINTFNGFNVAERSVARETKVSFRIRPVFVDIGKHPSLDMRIKLPLHAVFHHDLHLMVFRPRGVVTEKWVRDAIKALETSENNARQPFNRFSDLSKVKAIELGFGTTFRISLHRRLFYAKHPPVKSAFYVTTDEAARVVKLHAMLTDYSPLRVKMFDDLQAAAKWLNVSLETLELDPWPLVPDKPLVRRASGDIKHPAKRSASERKKKVKHYEYN